GPTPIRARAVEGALAGASVDSLAPAAELADEGTNPPSDTNATAEYRRHLARVLVRRAVEEALAR
ncbi:MAG: xanthine dehydrogenase family protein subunit M, partial [Gaiellaceae bacterium]